MTNSTKIAILISMTGMLAFNPAAAQRKHSVDFTPHIGVMTPMAEVVRAGAISANSPAARHDVDRLFGGLFTYWWSPEWGFELGAMYAPNAIEGNAFGAPDKVDAQFVTVSGRLVYDFGRNPEKPAFMLTGGLGVFATKYDDPLSMKTGGMGLVGLGLRIPLATWVGIRIELTDYLTFTNWELQSGDETAKLLQNDLTIKGGLTFSFGEFVR